SVTISRFRKSADDLGIHLEDKDEPDPPGDPGGQSFSSPLVLDLDGDGVTSVSRFDADVHFDLDGDGSCPPGR
ncbi:calcium-binding protein, partial [Dissulfurirhabdus thermomarina]|nr:calcium-binding protein [Dissulfurirhabdus thermomarina]